MEIMTSWKAEGIKEGMQQGMQQGELSLVMRQLIRKLGVLPTSVVETISTLNLTLIEDLGDALLDFNKREDLETWLVSHGKVWN